MLTNDQLATHLPAGAYGNYTLNLAALGSANISIVGWLPPLLKGVANMITEVNLARQTAKPPLDAIDLAVKTVTLDSEKGTVQIQYVLNFYGDLSNIDATIQDPTAPAISAPTAPVSTPTTPIAPGAGTSPGIPGAGILQP